ncbi:MAG: ATP synthase F1 subunit epsilon [Rhizobiales bacterium 65-9]|nr:F0F1 ATP synthase subunit epsilon [Hyphomicrobiales bacterium]OJY36434.1 MAG: ATP synthase F1 subunit epsilon [Rhizobiales bacterium 65-9]
MANFHFELVSPERMLFSGDVESVVVPGADGEFQVFSGHAPVMSTLHAGVLRIAGNAGAPQRVFVRGGFADVSASGLTVLAEQAVDLAEVKTDQLMQDIKNAEEDLADAKTDDARARAQSILDGLRALQTAVAH